MTNSRQKGARGERELANYLKKQGFTEARRGQQYSGANGDPDVVGLPHIHIECKRVQKLNLDSAMDQARNEAREKEMPAVFHRKNGKKWQVNMDFDDWVRLYISFEGVMAAVEKEK